MTRRLLAIETSGTAGSVAALLDAHVVASVSLDRRQRSGQSLAPALASVLTEAGWRPRDVELVAVTVGPGSFTGLRIGVTTAKIFAFAVGARVLAVNTLEAIAAQAERCDEPLDVVLDAQRSQLYRGTFARDAAARLATIRPTEIIGEDEWLRTLPSGAAVTGPGLIKLLDRLPPAVRPLSRLAWEPTAAAVGRVALENLATSPPRDPAEVLPVYYRLSAAEEKWAERHAQRDDRAEGSSQRDADGG